jgi:hypothetical protein
MIDPVRVSEPVPERISWIEEAPPLAASPSALEVDLTGSVPTTFARPQSTTRVSPNSPSMMLAGFRSRCRTLRVCAK